jgi:hypothetical protein
LRTMAEVVVRVLEKGAVAWEEREGEGAEG